MDLIDFIKPMKYIQSPIEDILIKQCTYYEYLALTHYKDLNDFVSSNLGLNDCGLYLSRKEINELTISIVDYSTMNTEVDVLNQFLRECKNDDVMSNYYMTGCDKMDFYKKPLMLMLLDFRANYLLSLKAKRGR
ncbi:MAG: Pseudogene of conserved hypothetical protein [Methanobrevibacter sp. CfCl-M3]